MAHDAFADITIGGACPGGAQSAQSADGNNAICVSGSWQYSAYTFQSVAASAGASCSGTTVGTVRYNSTLTGTEFCNGSLWVQLQPVASTPSIPAPSGSGYFVMTVGTWNGNLGGYDGADAKFLTDLTTNTGWMGYSTANSNGQLVADKVHAFLCASTAYLCKNLMPSTTYYFADANNGSSGGASFTTDSGGIGPANASNWSGATYFGASYTWWSGAREATNNTHWQNVPPSTLNWGCAVWSAASGINGGYGTINSTTSTRWKNINGNCASTNHLICFVNP